MLGNVLYDLYAKAYEESNTGVDSWEDLEDKDKFVWNRLAELATQPAPIVDGQPCKGMNCGTTTGTDHSLECQAEHAAAIAGDRFVKPLTTAQAIALGRECAIEEKNNLCEPDGMVTYDYLLDAEADKTWTPHGWVINAILKANGGE